MSDRPLQAEVDDLIAARDALARLVDSAYARAGSIRAALEHAALQRDIEQMRVEVVAVINFPRDSAPNQEPYGAIGVSVTVQPDGALTDR